MVPLAGLLFGIFRLEKAVAVVCWPSHGAFGTKLRFGVCGETNDPKIVKIMHINRLSDVECISRIPRQVEVFTLSSGVWRSPYSNVPRKSIRFGYFKVGIYGFLCWLATDRTTIGGQLRSYNLIISFDMMSEEFREVNLPNSLAHHMSHWNLSMYKLRESLVVLEGDVVDSKLDLSVWMMEDGAPKSFTKLLTLSKPHASISFLRGFKKTSEPIFEIMQDDGTGSLAVYEPYSKHINSLGINGNYCLFSVHPYVETLLLLDQPDFIAYDKVNAMFQSVELRIEGF
ncbi:hypothetical protein L1987_46238 [Smallanthus sonchifolius]|uniref:Uncharacterized protein n=1 Tax=Smallanthus sonchifolius TaxID=185202 RepID=A0ACB9FZ34_9ASTR|nr:hypothetical protein L1987_46238 [Smallanthus sonchifolius]